mgnify:CR=1 FL=1
MVIPSSVIVAGIVAARLEPRRIGVISRGDLESAVLAYIMSRAATITVGEAEALMAQVDEIPWNDEGRVGVYVA